MKKFLIILQVSLIIIIIIFGYKIVNTYIEDKKDQQNYAEIQQQFNKLKSESEHTARPQFDALEKINKDIVGWIQLPETSLNYPVLQGKTNHEYLHLNFKREERRRGSIFMDYRNKLNLLNDNTMFDVLEQYLNQSFYDKHPTILFDNKYGKYQLQIFSAYKTTTKNNYIKTTFTNKQQFQQFLKKTRQQSVIKSQVNVSEDDQIMTLSTCEDAYSETEKRIVVVAKIIKLT